MKPHTGYALVRDGKLILFDARAPIYWRKMVASDEMHERLQPY